MGLSFRKSVKLGKYVRLNFSKNGVGISAGVKGASVSLNKRGVRTSVGKGGLRYTESYSFKNKNRNLKANNLTRMGSGKKLLSNALRSSMENNRMVQNHTQEEINQFKKEHYTRHIKLIFGGIASFIPGLIFPPILLITFTLMLCGIICMIKNWKRINEEYKIRINK